MPTAATATPIARVTTISMENSALALSRLPSPSVLATSALPPVPIMKPSAPKAIRNGMIRLIAAKGVLPTKLDTKRPSTTP